MRDDVTTPHAFLLEPLKLSLSMGVIGEISFDGYVICDPCMVCLHGLSKYCGLAFLPTPGFSLRSLSQLPLAIGTAIQDAPNFLK